MVEVLVEHDYTAQEPDELTIKKGDIITEVLKKPGGWWEGKLKEKVGMFPDNFVRIIDKDSVVLRNKKDVTRIRQCRVVFSYNQDHEDELNLKVGDIINVIGEEEEGWWRGKLNGKEGVFPSNFVEEIAPISTNKPRPSIREDLHRLSSEPPVLPSKPAKQYCEVKFSYKALNEDELNLREGEIVTLISKDTQDPGWWKGEVNGKIGVFPDNFVIILPDEKKPSNIEPKPDNIGAIKHSSIASQRKSLEVRKDEPKPSTNSTKHDGSKPEHPQSDSKTPPVPGKKPSISLKKSPSGSGSGFLSKIKDKIVDAVDGATGSKPKTDSSALNKENNPENNNNNNVFDQVERIGILQDVRANRARAPGRRLPTSIYKEDDEEIPGLPNGNIDHSKPEFIPKIISEPQNKGEILSTKPEATSRPESFSKSDKSDTLESSSSSEQLDAAEIKPKTREWETKKVPWLEEMKANQARRSTGPSPGPETRHRLSNTPDPKSDAEGSKSSQNSPAEKEVHLMDMSKSMTDMKISPLESVKVGLRPKTPTNELEKISPLRSKPVVPPASGKPPIGSLPPREPLSKPAAPQPKLTPKPSSYENTTVSKPPIVSGVHSSATSVLNSALSSHHATSNHSVLSNLATSHSALSSSTANHSASSHVSHSVSHSSVSHHSTSKSHEILSGSHKIHEIVPNDHAESTVSLRQFNEVLERLEKLESTVERQSHMIDELKSRLQVESDMRMMLQEKMAQLNNVQV